MDLPNPDTHYEANSFSFNPLRCGIEFAIERARFDLWVVAVVAMVTLLWNVVGRALRFHMDSQKHDKSASVSGG